MPYILGLIFTYINIAKKREQQIPANVKVKELRLSVKTSTPKKQSFSKNKNKLFSDNFSGYEEEPHHSQKQKQPNPSCKKQEHVLGQ